MSLILFDFTKNLDTISRLDYSDAFATTLREQFQRIKDTHLNQPKYKKLDLEKFMTDIFKSAKMQMFLPRINKELHTRKTEKHETHYLNNVAVTIKSPASKQLFGASYDFNLICDCVIKSYASSLVVKGFSILSSKEYKVKKLDVDAVPALAFTTIGVYDTPNYNCPKGQLKDTFLTEELCQELIDEYDYLANKDDAYESYLLWMKYLDFRNYYLDVQTSEEYPIDKVNVIEGYSVSRKTYMRDKVKYKQYLYQSNEELEKGIHVLLTSPVEGSEKISLIKVNLTLAVPLTVPHTKETEKEINKAVRKMRRFSNLDLKVQDTNNEKNYAPLGERYNVIIKPRELKETDTSLIIDVELYYHKSNFSKNYSMLYKKLQTQWVLKINPIGEKRKLERQKDALKNFFDGYTKNPNLLTYLFNPTHINSSDAVLENMDYFLPTLNDSQKMAVTKALKSNGIFLLQGPPGTGKTQVIAELTTQLVKRGKKVFISSETHKAIDNVFDRLPKASFIHPLKLMGYSNKVNDHGIDKLVDNFYNGIAHNIQMDIGEHTVINQLFSQMTKLYERREVLESQKEALWNDVTDMKELANADVVLDAILTQALIRKETLSTQKETFKKIYESILAGDLKNPVYQENPVIANGIQNIINKVDSKLSALTEYSSELANFSAEDLPVLLEMEDGDFKGAILLRSIKKIYDMESNKMIDFIATSVTAINSDLEMLNDSILPKVEHLLDTQQTLVQNAKAWIAPIEAKSEAITKKIVKLTNEIDGLVSSNFINRHIVTITEYENLKESNFDKDSVLPLLKGYIDKVKREHDDKGIDVLNDIVNYITDPDTIENDKSSLTEDIVKTINVFGATCSSSSFFSGKNIAKDEDIILDDINLKKVDIDVVIIDEISKLSLLDILVPISYGKTLILVGDHRQLPPMYDLKHMRPDEFNELDKDIITYEDNVLYTKLCEECYFKLIYERMPQDNKIMLDTQYRCHEDIMGVFNFFYNNGTGGLKVGSDKQNALKQHELNIDYKFNTLLQEDKHVYFVDVNGFESRNQDSTSIINEDEADAIVKLLELMNDEYGRMIQNNELDKRYSVGVICTYRDQANLIRNKIRDNKLKLSNFSNEPGERLIISTVDDFQGDERDIILVSMVRNPDYTKNRNNTSFIDKFERINVAYSRARSLLCIVGSRDFLSQSKIDLPDINGDMSKLQKGVPIYQNIIDFIEAKGKIIDQVDLLGERIYG